LHYSGLDGTYWNPVLGPLKMHTDGVSCVAFSPNGRRIASGSLDETVLVWDAVTGKVVVYDNIYEGQLLDKNKKFIKFPAHPDASVTHACACAWMPALAAASRRIGSKLAVTNTHSESCFGLAQLSPCPLTKHFHFGLENPVGL